MSDFKTNLVQSADAAARVGVLFVAVAMFAAMWESDSPPSNTEDNWLARRAGASNSVADRDDKPMHAVEQSGTRSSVMPMFEPVSRHSAPARPYPMPAGIAPGEYRVVDSLGMTDTLHVTAEMVSLYDSQNTSDQYLIENGDRKIFFIRIQGTTAIAGAHFGAILR
jgi:anti-sigma factor RsiW